MNEVPFQSAVDAKLVHSLPGRIRVRAAALKDSRLLTEDLVGKIARINGVEKVVGRPATGSIIIEYKGSARPIIKEVVDKKLLRFSQSTTPVTVAPLSIQAKSILDHGDQFLINKTKGLLDVKSAMAIALLIAAGAQALRGRFLGPTTALLLGAFSLIEAKSEMNDNQID